MSKREIFNKNNPELYKTFELIYKQLMLIEEYEICLKELHKAFRNKIVNTEFKILGNIIENSIKRQSLLEVCKLIDNGKLSYRGGLLKQLKKLNNKKYNTKIDEHDDVLNKHKTNIKKIKNLFIIRDNIIAHNFTNEEVSNKTFHISDDPNDRHIDDVVKLLFDIYEYWSKQLMDTSSGSWNERDKKMYVTEPCQKLAELFCNQ